jgi:hypothetical protein
MKPAFVTQMGLSFRLRRTLVQLYLCAAILIVLILLASNSSCNQPNVKANTIPPKQKSFADSNIIFTNKAAIIHVFVALCDNVNQGIVPVPKAIGNGQDPANNLYWGCDYGIKSFFRNKTEWQLVATRKKLNIHILERCIFKHKNNNSYLVADAYDGAFIKECTTDFIEACAGAKKDTTILKDTLGITGNASLLAYIGHDGLMDFKLTNTPAKKDKQQREAIILACKSKWYFANIIQKTGAKPLLWTTQFMCPEAYTLDAALSGWLKKETDTQIHLRAASAYSKYQHCSVKAASNLLVTGYE